MTTATPQPTAPVVPVTPLPETAPDVADALRGVQAALADLDTALALLWVTGDNHGDDGARRAARAMRPHTKPIGAELAALLAARGLAQPDA